MTLDLTFREFFSKFQMPTLSAADWRTGTNKLRQQFLVASHSIERDAPELAEIRNCQIDGPDGPLNARLYVPMGAGTEPGPGIIFFHGGGFVLGDLDSHHMLCIRLADASRCRVLAVEYRLAPENKFPAAHDDAWAAWSTLQDKPNDFGMDPTKLAVSGDSAGGNLSVFIAQEAIRTETVLPIFQLLLYPLVQFVDIRTKKMSMQESGFFISTNLFEFFRDSYVEDEDKRMDVRVSPLFAPDDSFKGLPPAHLVLCGWDPLRDEGNAYAAKMASFGVPVTVREHPGMVHGFMSLSALSNTVKSAIRDAGEVAGHAMNTL